jgi:hypothetical protein
MKKREFLYRNQEQLVNIDLSRAYKAIALLELAKGKKVLGVNSLKSEIKHADEDLLEIIEAFNAEVASLHSLVEDGLDQDIVAHLIYLRGFAMSIGSTMDNLVLEIDKLFQKGDFFDE